MDHVAFLGTGGAGEEIAANFSILADVGASSADLAGSGLLGSSAFLAVLLVFDFALLAALGAARTDFLRSVAVAFFAFVAAGAVLLEEGLGVALLAFGAGLVRFAGAARFGLAVVAEDFLGVDLVTGFLTGVFFDGLAITFFVAVFAGVRLAEAFALVAFVDFLGVAFFVAALRAAVLEVAFFFVVTGLGVLRGAAGFGEANSSLESNAF